MATEYTIRDRFIGSGYIFPLELQNGKPRLRVGELELIRSSIMMLISWPKNDRFFLGEFGSRIEECIGQPNDDILSTLVYQFISDAINNFERRIELLDIGIIRPNNTSINIRLTYKIRTTNLEDSFIFPFYRSIKY